MKAINKKYKRRSIYSLSFNVEREKRSKKKIRDRVKEVT